jgi:predicted DNA-binding mobile mystery protein A
MNNLKKPLMQKHLDELIQSYTAGNHSIKLSVGWIQYTRLALGMSLRQLAHRIGISASALTNFEKREQTEAITLATLKKAANAMDMELVYYFKPKSGSLKNTISIQAKKKAQEILIQSNQTMRLEGQDTDQDSQNQELERLTRELADNMPKSLWD